MDWLGIIVVIIIVGGLGYFIRSCIRFMRASHRAAIGRCEECGFEVEEGRCQCPKCGVKMRPDGPRVVGRLDNLKLVNDWPDEQIAPRDPEKGETKVIVYEPESDAEASCLRQQLEARGVAAWVTREKAAGLHRDGSQYYPFVAIWAGDVERAQGIIDLFRRDSSHMRRQVS